MSDIDNLTGDVLGLDTNPNAPAESLAAGSKSRNPTAKNMGRTVKSRLSQAAEKSNPTAGTEDQSDDDEDEDDPQIIDCLRTAGKQGDEEDADVKARSKMLKEALEAQVAGNSAKADQILAKIQLKMVTTAAAPAKNVVTVAKRARIEEGGNDRVKENGFVFYKAEVNLFLGLGLPPFFDKNMKELKAQGMPYQPQPGFGYPPAQQPPSFHPMQQPFFQPFGVPAQAQTGPPRFGGPVRDHLVNKEEDEEGTEGTGEIRV
ncbi:hypothetical protein PtA15_1A912 [Puccinia triticina]|uniref:Uncharacterized protein n=1 Tax=Puccinia triticina TaxID=208348 RepID=A0ABY7C9U8_9BASI|nr:uncharacterized protein PtA15_1A912 [Puccinia triticina]WAQ81570.1 hypothetical protein PtA15_1A912 [Puccinia triticina]